MITGLTAGRYKDRYISESVHLPARPTVADQWVLRETGEPPALGKELNGNDHHEMCASSAFVPQGRVILFQPLV